MIKQCKACGAYHNFKCPYCGRATKDPYAICPKCETPIDLYTFFKRGSICITIANQALHLFPAKGICPGCFNELTIFSVDLVCISCEKNCRT